MTDFVTVRIPQDVWDYYAASQSEEDAAEALGHCELVDVAAMGCSRCASSSILADTENWFRPACHACWCEMGQPEKELLAVEDAIPFPDVLPLLRAAQDALSADNGSEWEHDSFKVMDDVFEKVRAKLSPEQREVVDR